MRFGITNEVLFCCGDGVLESCQHLCILTFMDLSFQNTFSTITGVISPFLQLKDTIFKWWNT